METQSPFLQVDRVERALRLEVARLRRIPGAKLDQENILAERYKVSRQTLRQALERLKEENLIRSTRGSGTFVVPNTEIQTEVYYFTVESFHPFVQVAGQVLEKMLKRLGYSFHPVISDDPLLELDRIQRRPEALGIFLLGGVHKRSAVEAIVKQSELPVVSIGFLDEPYLVTPICDMVTFDIMALVYKAVEHLVQQGHQKIAMLHWPYESVWNREMLRCYQESLQILGITPDPRWVVDLPSDALTDINQDWMDRASKQINDWFEQGNAPTAMLHISTSEARMHDLLHMVFRGHFQTNAVIPLTSWEVLQMMYTGIRDATAVVYKFEELIQQAINLLLRQKTEKLPPIRETMGRVYLCQRQMGLWSEK
jgi:DNA-binding LacI/PurR family transcriptional regulator